jgi:hypothetical protein
MAKSHFFKRWGWLALAFGLVGFILPGCQKDEIEHYAVAKEKPELRMLGAIIPHGNRTWFIKLRGPAYVIDDYQDEFHGFLRSIRFTEDAKKPIAWKVPEGWTEEGGRGMRYATLRLGPKDAPQELTVIPLGKEASSVLANINRWRGELGLREVAATDLPKITSQVKLGRVKATIVDMKGPGARNNGMQTPRMRQPPSRPSVDYRTPKEWKKLKDPGQLRLAAFQVEEGDNVAEVGVAAFPGRAGGLLLNVNRWRRQVDLGPVATADQLRKDLREMQVAGEPAVYLDLIGPAGGNGRKRILGVMTVQDDYSWFFTMKGPADLVEQQKPAFEAFLKSVRFDRAKGDDHE